MQLIHINIYRLIKKKLSLESLLFIGGGLKIFGHAFLDELALWLFIIKNFKSISYFNINIRKIDIRTVTLLLLSINSLITTLLLDISFFLEQLRMLVFFLFLTFLSYSEIYKKINFSKALMGSFIFIFFSLFLGLAEIYIRVNYLADSTCLTSKSIKSSCKFFTAFWQESFFENLFFLSWVGTAFASSYLFAANILILKNKKEWSGFSTTLAHIVVGIFHHSRLTNLFSIIVFFYYLINKKIFVFFLITSLIIFISYFLYNYLPNNFIFIIKLYLKDFYKILKITYWHIIDFNFSDLDSGRYNQLLALLSYCIDNPISAIFGNVTSFHKYGLKEYIEFDSTNVLRPIGIVRLIYDWGIIIFALITFIMIKQIIRNLKKITSYVNFLYYLMIPLCFYFSITITDMTTSILFWLFIFNLKYD